jgi:hypothetical protein
MPSPVVASTSATQPVTGLSTITINKPTGTASGDLLFAAIHCLTNPTVTPPAGWDLILSQTQGTNQQIFLYEIIAGGSEPASYDWGISPANFTGGFIARITGVDTAAPINAQASANNSLSQDPQPAPSVTTTVADTLVIRGLGFDRNQATRSITVPTGYTEIVHLNSATVTSPQLKVGTLAVAAIGATGTADFDLSAARQAAVFTIAIAPATGAATYTASADLTASSVTLAATATHAPPTYTASADLPTSSATLSAVAAHVTPTYAATASLTAAAASVAASVAVVNPIYAATASLTASTATLAATVSHATAIYQATAALAASSVTLAAAAAHVTPTYTASAALAASPATLEATAGHIPPTYTAGADLTASAVTLAASATFAAAPLTATASLVAAEATLSASVEFVAPEGGVGDLSIFLSPIFSHAAGY